MSVINAELKKKHSGFDLKDYGYSRISGFLRSIQGIIVEGNRVMMKKGEDEKNR